jgi:hypothetical protein
MNNQLQPTKDKGLRALPNIEELYNDAQLVSKWNDLNKLTNCEPKKEWVKQNKFANNSNYIPIEIVEYLLTSIYVKWRVEVKGIMVIANSVVVTVRLWFLDPITGDWDWQEGVGASPIQTAKGAAATDFGQVNTSAVQMAAPAAETYAVKDAAEKLGKIFGKDLNRKDQVNYDTMMYGKFSQPEKQEIPEDLKYAISIADKDNLKNIYGANPNLHSNPEFMQLLNKRKLELNGSRTTSPA